jgi:phage tail tape-measure protein
VVDEPANDFESFINRYHDVQNLQKLMAELKKGVDNVEREMRDGIADSLRAHFGKNLKEGVNDYVLSNRRKVKFDHKVDRKVDKAMVETARKAFEEADDAAGTFDDLLRVKYELSKAQWNKLASGGQAYTAVARCLVTKFAAPSVSID